MAGATLCMSLLDAISKELVQKYPVTLIVWARYCLQTLLVLAIFGYGMRSRLFVTRFPALQLFRGVLMVASTYMMVLALRHLPLAAATAINFASPSMVTILAVLVLREHLTPVRILAIVAGLIGVLLIVRPGSAVFQAAAVYPILAALAVAIYQVVTRKLALDDARTTLFYSSAVGAVGMSVLAPWSGPALDVTLRDAAGIAAVGLLGAGGHFLFIRALQAAPASGLAAITYVQLVFATLLGIALFGEYPDGWAIAGMLVIMASGFTLTWYERRHAARLLRAAPTGD